MRKFVSATMLVVTLGLVGNVSADDKADEVRQAVKDYAKKVLLDRKASVQDAQTKADALAGLYTDEVIKAIGSDPAKLKAKPGQDRWFKSAVGNVLLKGSAAYMGKVGRLECAGFASEKAALVFQAKPEGVLAIFIPYKDGKLDSAGLKALQPEQSARDKAVWLIKAPGAGYVQLLQRKK